MASHKLGWLRVPHFNAFGNCTSIHSTIRKGKAINSFPTLNWARSRGRVAFSLLLSPKLFFYRPLANPLLHFNVSRKFFTISTSRYFPVACSYSKKAPRLVPQLLYYYRRCYSYFRFCFVSFFVLSFQNIVKYNSVQGR